MTFRILTLLLGFSLISVANPESLFDGKTLAGWETKGASVWTVEEGVIVGQSNPEKNGSTLWTENEYTDFVLNVKSRFEGEIDSGVFLRHENDQIQIGTSGSLKRDMTASPYIDSKRGYPVEAEGISELLKSGEWNSMKISVKGGAYSVELNGKKVMEYKSDTAIEAGPIGPQVHAGREMKVSFKDLTLEAL